MSTAVSIWLALLLGAAGVMKAWRADETARSLATYGIRAARRQRLAAGALIAVELGMALALAVGAPGAAGAATALFCGFALVTTAALTAGRGGRPCVCFGSGSRLGWWSPVRAGGLALLAGGLAGGWFGHPPSGYALWLTVGLSLSIAATAFLSVAVLALAREVGVLRMSVGGRGALELDDEGPRLGAQQSWAMIAAPPRAVLLLAIFTSDGCPMCHQLAPAIDHVAHDPLLGVRVFDERADAPAWRAASVPGSPYAVALDLEGVALAKGTFNGLGELESVVATARARDRRLALAA